MNKFYNSKVMTELLLCDFSSAELECAWIVSLTETEMPRDSQTAMLFSSVKGHPVYPLGLHTCHPGEMYIEQIAVSADARGMGIGTTLLRW